MKSHGRKPSRKAIRRVCAQSLAIREIKALAYIERMPCNSCSVFGGQLESPYQCCYVAATMRNCSGQVA
ncbi:hypothetical protein J6590_095762 [Homalodisca vitripennis]|nr:hypothetical protein J6590_095762 [Homalodisca vitripennis]